MSGFPCDSCGLCCQNISGISDLVDFDLGNGVCKYFDSTTRLCSIYDKRPLICRVDEMYTFYYSRKINKEEFYRLNQNVCENLKNKNKE